MSEMTIFVEKKKNSIRKQERERERASKDIDLHRNRRREIKDIDLHRNRRIYEERGIENELHLQKLKIL